MPRPRKNSRRRKKSRTNLALGIALFLFAALSLAGFIAFFFIGFPGPRPSPRFPQNHFPAKAPSVQYEETGPAARPPAPPKKPGPRNHPAQRDAKPQITILIDDMGYRQETGIKMLQLDLNLSFSFLPFGPHTESLAHLAQQRGRDILLHLPLEPTDKKWNPGPGALLLSMDKARRKTQFERDLAAVPMAIGVNNHMGSLFTENRPAMAALLTLVKDHGLFFVDSLTSSRSVVGETARRLGVKTLHRHVFLDNVRDRRKITAQLDALLKHGEKYGWAIGIGHPYPSTLAALSGYREQLRKQAHLVGMGVLIKNHDE